MTATLFQQIIRVIVVIYVLSSAEIIQHICAVPLSPLALDTIERQKQPQLHQEEEDEHQQQQPQQLQQQQQQRQKQPQLQQQQQQQPGFAINSNEFLVPDDPKSTAPKNINTGKELEALGKYVAPVLYGGLGNVLFQLAALHVYAKQVDVPCVVGFFKHWNRQFHTFAPWGGHEAPGRGTLTLKTVFPNLLWLSIDTYQIFPKTVANKYAFAIETPDEYIAMPDKQQLPLQVHGYFFNSRYWHSDRDYVLHMLEFNPAIDRYLFTKYADVIGNNTHLESVSVHARFGYRGEPAKGLLEERKFPPKEFLEQSFLSLGLDNKVFLIFSDDVEQAMTQFARFERAGFDLRFVEENSVMSLRLMSLCQHHIMTSSTLSFWGAYLDAKQPTGGRTIFHNSFYDAHGKNMVPYSSWEVVD